MKILANDYIDAQILMDYNELLDQFVGPFHLIWVEVNDGNKPGKLLVYDKHCNVKAQSSFIIDDLDNHEDLNETIYNLAHKRNEISNTYGKFRWYRPFRNKELRKKLSRLLDEERSLYNEAKLLEGLS